jgi:hypothetical protein
LIKLLTSNIYVYKIYVCSRGIKRDARNSIFCGCTASIKGIVDHNSLDKNSIKVTYNWKHVGHNSTSIDDIRNGPTQRTITAFIQEQVNNNMTWYNIKNMLRLDKEVLSSLLDEDNITAIPIGLNVKYNDVYYAMKKSMEKRARLHSDMKESLQLWEKKII